MTALAPAAPVATRAMTPPEAALLRAVDLGALLVIAAGGIATAIAAALSGGVAGGIAAGTVIALAFTWTTRLAMLRASSGPASEIAVWVMVSYAAKGVLILVGVTLAAHYDRLSRPGFGLTLVAGIVASVTLQVLLQRQARVESLQPEPTVPTTSFDDDAAVAAARAANARSAGKVPGR